MPLLAEAETIVAESVVLVNVCDEPAVTPVVEAPLTPARVLLLGLIARLVTATVCVPEQQEKSVEVAVTLQPAPDPRLSVMVIVPMLPVALPADSDTVVAERVAVLEVDKDRLPAFTVA